MLLGLASLLPAEFETRPLDVFLGVSMGFW
jgi:hypothetical protein